MKRLTASICITALLGGCAVAPLSMDYSLIDLKGVNTTKYEADYDECRVLANQTDVADRAAGGAVFGALLGAVIGGALCGRNCATSAAGWGAQQAVRAVALPERYVSNRVRCVLVWPGVAIPLSDKQLV